MFADCHIHMLLDGVMWKDAIDRHRQSVQEDYVRGILEEYRTLGFDYLRDGGDRWGVGDFASRIAPEYGISYRTPCFPIHRKGHYGSFIGRGFETEEEFRALVNEVKSRGGNFIKVMISGIMDFDHYGVLTDTPMPEDDVRRIADIAHEAGFSVMAHANGDEAVRAAIHAGIESFEHGAYLSEETLDELAESNTVWVPTVVTIGALIDDARYSQECVKPLLQYQFNAISYAAKHGAFIAPGSDAGAYNVPHGRGGLREIELLRTAIGENADVVLGNGLEKVKELF